MRIGFIGCVEFSKCILKELVKLDFVSVEAVVTKKESAFNSDFRSLDTICSNEQISCFYYENKNDAAMYEFLKNSNLDVIYCFGWSHLLDSKILELTPKGVIGFHPAMLPQNRGRHPVIWALTLGLNETASTFFKMDEGADSGPILSQQKIQIRDNDNSSSLYKKIEVCALKQVTDFTYDLANNAEQLLIQDESKASYWRKRSRKDGLIDFRMNATCIHNLVRALAPPYPCAEFGYKQELLAVRSSRVSSRKFPINIEPGTVIESNEIDGSLLVKTAQDEAIWLNEIVGKLPQKGEYL